MSKDLVRAHVWVEGRVQGVAYRHFARTSAVRLGVTGWVRNLPDGRVEVVAEGPARDVEAFLDRLREGPSLARIDGFDVRREPATEEFEGFRVDVDPG